MIVGTVAIVQTLLICGRRVVEALDRRERRPRARLAAPALERVEQRRLLAADVRAGAAVDDDLDVAEDPRVARLVDGGLEDLVLGQVLAADVDEDVASTRSRARRSGSPRSGGAGRVVITSRSLNAPGSDSSALTTRYFGFADLRSISEALRPVGKPAPPRPRRFEVESSRSARPSSSPRAFATAS